MTIDVNAAGLLAQVIPALLVFLALEDRLSPSHISGQKMRQRLMRWRESAVMMHAGEKKRVSALTVEEVQELRLHIAQWAGEKSGRAATLDAMDMFLATGLRPGELLALQFSDVDFRAGTITVTGTVKRDTVNGLHRQAFPKSESGKRVLTLPLFGVELLRRRKVTVAGDLVFPNRNGDPMEPANFRRLWREARGDVWEAVKPSSFRKAVATLIERERIPYRIQAAWA